MNAFILSEKDFSKIIKSRDNKAWYRLLSEKLPINDINTIERVSGFLAQCSAESNNFKVLEENLNYSVTSLKRVFGRYFEDRDPREYAHNAEKLANYVYMDEFRTNSLGNVCPGDGWKFRGRGIKQITGRRNYEEFSRDYNITVDEAIDYLTTKEGALESAIWFWKKENCNEYADKRDIRGMTIAINGGLNGIDKRERVWKLALSVLEKEEKVVGRTDIYLSIASRGKEVEIMQRWLNLKDDGVFGPNTHRAVKEFQRKNGLLADGIAGPKTLSKLYQL